MDVGERGPRNKGTIAQYVERGRHELAKFIPEIWKRQAAAMKQQQWNAEEYSNVEDGRDSALRSHLCGAGGCGGQALAPGLLDTTAGGLLRFQADLAEGSFVLRDVLLENVEQRL